MSNSKSLSQQKVKFKPARLVEGKFRTATSMNGQI